MMNGCEKSDPAIVAAKPTNKAERSAAQGNRVKEQTPNPVGRFIPNLRVSHTPPPNPPPFHTPNRATAPRRTLPPPTPPPPKHPSTPDLLRSRWSQGRGPRETRTRLARSERRIGKARHTAWTAYGKRQGTGRRRGSPRSSTMSASICLKRRSSISRRTPLLAWTN